MSIPKLKAAAWVDGEPLTPTQINQLNDLLPNLMDMVGGSTHTPAAKINVFGPEGMHIDTLVASSAAVGTLGVETALTGNGSINVANSIKGNSFALNSAQTPSIAIPLLAYGSTYWDAPFDSAVSGTIVRQNNVGGGDLIFFALPPLPRGCTILGVTADVKPEATHTGVPGTKPLVQLEWVDYTTNTTNAVASQVDPSATTGAYDVMHAITAACSHAYNPSRVYRVRMRGESGANALTSGGKALAIYGLTVQVSGTGIHL